MAKYINPVATGQAINQGEAQVFDTTGLMKYSLDRKDKAKAAAQADKEKKEKALLDSLVDVNTSNLANASNNKGGFEFSVVYQWKVLKKEKSIKQEQCPKYL